MLEPSTRKSLYGQTCGSWKKAFTATMPEIPSYLIYTAFAEHQKSSHLALSSRTLAEVALVVVAS